MTVQPVSLRPGVIPTDAPPERDLLTLVHSFALVSFPVEVWRQVLPLHAGVARIDRVSGPLP